MVKRVATFLHSPLAVVLSLGLGILTGIYFPDLAHALSPVSKMYIDLLKMIILPLIVSSIILSLRSIIHDPKAGTYLAKVIAAVVLVSLASVAIGGSLTVTVRPGEISDPETRAAFGHIVSKDTISTELQMNLRKDIAPSSEARLLERLVALVPSNIFEALASGDTVKVLIFALVFGLAMGRVPFAVSDPLAHSLDTVYRSCIILTRWFNLILPFATYAMISEQTAVVGLRTFRLMFDFVSVVGLVAVVLGSASVFVVAMRSKRSPWQVLRAYQDVAMMAIATRSSVTCIPAMIDLLTERLSFRRDVIELLVPLLTALVRAGPIVLYVVGPIFVAQLYGRALTVGDLAFIGILAALLGPATSGMAGITIVAQVGIICGYLGLPFEAAFVLFASVDAVTDTLRTLILVFTISAATAAIAPTEPHPEHVYAPEEVIPPEPVAPRVAS